jgi:PAS domain S-box-containing protein
MNPLSWFGADGDRDLQVLWEDGERVFCRGERHADGHRAAVLAVLPAAEHPTPATIDRLVHEHGLKDELDGAWAARPIELVRDRGRTMLVLEDTGGEPLHRLLGAPMEMRSFLRLAVAVAAALVQVHRRGLVHKDVKPANILVNRTTGEVRLTGFGMASRLPRERQAPTPPESIAGTLAYMAPEQTGRMNRSIDARSDLYALGMTFYQMLTGSLPFRAAEPMEWVHCHIARKPLPPRERLQTIPAAVSDLVLKLVAKTAEERYQTAAGLERDLRRCLAEWETHHRIDAFSLGEADAPDRLLIAERLYGREREVDALLAAFDRLVSSGRPELVLVSGYSGIGKSAVVNELHRALVPSRGLFAAGKFDQYKRDIPYATLAQAFQGLIRPLLAKSDAELAGRRDALLEALGPNGQLMVDLVPELKAIIGDQSPVSELPPQQAQSRFQLVFRRFIGVFARPEHPLTLFLDDLQWLDAATLEMLAHLLTRPDVQHLLVIGAYRDNEVDSTHPLMRKVDAIRKGGTLVQEISLAPLAREDLGRLIADTLSCTPPVAAPLTRLVHEKTGGNPFFAIQFISALAEEGLLRFDHEAARWRWEVERLHAKGYTDNVADLMVGKLIRLPVETQAALQHFASLGNMAEIAMLSIVLGKSHEDVRSVFWDAARLELVESLDGSYKFIHDRVQEAAYSLIPERSRAAAHLRIGRLLAAHTPAEGREETIFEVVNQLNRGATLMTSRDEREQLAELNLLAGQRAKAAAAYASALAYLTAGAAQLLQDSWERRHDLAFALELQRGECEFLTGALAEAERRLATLSSRAANTVEQGRVACLRLDLYTTLDQSSRAVAVGLDYLRGLGIDWSPHPTEEDARREYEQIWSQLANRTIESLIELPLMNDPASLATMDVLTKLGAPAGFADANLYFLVLSRAVNLSLERGNSDGSCFAYAWLGGMVGARFGDYDTGFRFARLGYELVEQRGLRRFQAKTYTNFGSLVPWTKHILVGRDVLHRAFDTANRIGALTDAAFSSYVMITNLLAAGDPLIDVQREAEHARAFADKMGFGLVIDITTTQLGLVRTLRGLTPKFGSFDEQNFEEVRLQRRFSRNPDLARAECWYWIRRAQARFFAGEYYAAVDSSLKAQQLLWASPSNFEVAEHCFYSALSNAACCGIGTNDQRQQHVDALTACHHRLQVWANNCPENFENRAALVGAEIARINGRDLEAMRLYEQAIRSARANGFVHNEALACELAARFYAARGFDKFSRMYLQDARYGYLRWGADGKVRQLDELYPYLREPKPAPTPTSTIAAPIEHLDLATVIKVSQAVSGEIVIEALIDTLMRTAIEQAGAERGLLILQRGAEPRVEAEATIGGDTAVVQLRDQPITAFMLPESVLHYVLRTRESVLLDDAATLPEFAADPYLRERKARSILCLPLVNQAKLIGVLYLENSLTTGAFAPAQSAVLKLLASQAAIALENAHLYRDLEQREAKIRRLVDANIIGIYLWELEGRIVEANDTFLRMVGYDREDLVSGRMLWTNLTPPELRDRTARSVEEMMMTGTSQPFEKEYFRKDGSRVPVLIGAANFDDRRDEGVAFVLDLTEQKRAEAEARESERHYREMQMEVAHANRVATMGQLTASIAHEVNQPITAALTNAQAALRWLAAGPPDLDEAKQALGRIVKDATRAGDVIGRIRDIVKKAPPRKGRVDINEAIREVIELTRGEAAKQGAVVYTAFGEGLPLIEADRVQLQQVVLNLIVNAVQAMGTVEQGPRELSITTGRAEPAGVLVAVKDSGPGLPPTNHAQLFVPFYTTKANGLGMGLSICRSIIEAHDGRLWATANLPRGAIFNFTLPAYPGRAS